MYVQNVTNVYGRFFYTNIYNSVVANFAPTAKDGKTYLVDYYNLDIIISVYD